MTIASRRAIPAIGMIDGLLSGIESRSVAGSFGSGVPVRPEPNRSFTARPQAPVAECLV